MKLDKVTRLPVISQDEVVVINKVNGEVTTNYGDIISGKMLILNDALLRFYRQGCILKEVKLDNHRKVFKGMQFFKGCFLPSAWLVTYLSKKSNFDTFIQFYDLVSNVEFIDNMLYITKLSNFYDLFNNYTIDKIEIVQTPVSYNVGTKQVSLSEILKEL